MAPPGGKVKIVVKYIVIPNGTGKFEPRIQTSHIYHGKIL